MQLTKSQTTTTVLGTVLALSFMTGACATKKHVREAIAPVQNQVNESNKKIGENTTAIGDLDRKLASADERASDIDKKATAAGEAAQKANEQALKASASADSANTLAQQGITKTGEVRTELQKEIDNLDNYKLVTTEKVLFGVSRSELTKEAKEQLDVAVQNMSSLKTYVIEVAGFTDKTGDRQYNLALSQRRADAVVRYLTLNHNIPLRRIHVIGEGAEVPDMDNKTRAARKENRRVEVKVFGLDLGGRASAQLESSLNN